MNTNGTGGTTSVGKPTAGTSRRPVRRDAGQRLRQEYQALFPDAKAIISLDRSRILGRGQKPSPDTRKKAVLVRSTHGWQSAVSHGATLGWALQTAGASSGSEFVVLNALCLASAGPIEVTDELFATGWTLSELSALMSWTGTAGFLGSALRIRDLHRAVPEISGPHRDPRWHAGATVLTATPEGLTDLQALRWLQAIPCASLNQSLGFGMWIGAACGARGLQEWLTVVGSDGWEWAAAGYTLDETRVLLALPETHPDRPGPDQLAVMAALRQT